MTLVQLGLKTAMNTLLRFATLIAGATLVAAACVTPEARVPPTPLPAPTSPPMEATTSAGPVVVQPLSAPIDASLAPVARSNPGPEAQAAIDACNLDPARITGMAKVADARDLPKYVRLTGREPELREAKPVWVITYSGRFTIRTIWADDPTCVVLDGEPILFLTGDYGRGDSVAHPLPVPDPPLALPPLAP